ncbi:MAG: hypothetical protein LBS31_01930 [Candidatus Adiutrix sp.]|jgi:hypothetical protein|nr:hypothetical protein [Candidatus Adiutrix sp.]
MYRLLVIAFLFWLIIALARSFVGPEKAGSPGPESEEMVKDALSGVYCAKSEAVSITRGGETLYFISLENRDRFLAARK